MVSLSTGYIGKNFVDSKNSNLSNLLTDNVYHVSQFIFNHQMCKQGLMYADVRSNIHHDILVLFALKLVYDEQKLKQCVTDMITQFPFVKSIHIQIGNDDTTVTHYWGHICIFNVINNIKYPVTCHSPMQTNIGTVEHIFATVNKYKLSLSYHDNDDVNNNGVDNNGVDNTNTIYFNPYPQMCIPYHGEVIFYTKSVSRQDCIDTFEENNIAYDENNIILDVDGKIMLSYLLTTNDKYKLIMTSGRGTKCQLPSNIINMIKPHLSHILVLTCCYEQAISNINNMGYQTSNDILATELLVSTPRMKEYILLL